MEIGPSLDMVVRPAPGTLFPRTTKELFSRPNMTIDPLLSLVPGSSVITIGSCFARNIEEAMSSVGFDVPMLTFRVPRSEWDGARPNGILNRYTPFSITQLVTWVVDCLEQPESFTELTEPYWIDTESGKGVDLDLGGLVPVGRDRFFERRRELLDAFSTLRTTELMVLTLGQTESWLYAPRELHWSGAPAQASLRRLWPETRLVTTDVDDVREHLRATVRLVRSINPGVRILLTVSPVPASRYWSGTPALRAYWQSKLTLWEAAQRVVSEEESVHYFPSFEAVHLAADAWSEDRLHVTDGAVRNVVQGLLAANSDEVLVVPREGDPGYVSNVSAAPVSLRGRLSAKARGLMN